MLTSTPLVPYTERTLDQLQATVMRAELAAAIDRLTQGASDGAHETAVPRLALARATHTHHPVHAIYEPALCVLAQGSKRVLLGQDVYVYDSSQYLVVAQNLPVSGQVVDASPEAPYLGLRLRFDVADISGLALELSLDSRTRRAQRGIFTGELTSSLLDPVLRLTRLLDTPEDVQALAPLITREILYRLLRSSCGWRLMQMAVADGHSQRIAQVIALLTQRFQSPLRVEELADEVHMSVSSLHLHFKSVTAMSPLQFQKQLRLQESRRIMIAEQVDAGTAGHRVGYESQSQFNREYSRFFGLPPARDIKRLRERQLGRIND